MRDFRHAKAMAQTLREALTTKAINISHSESLEFVSKMLGVADWNTLSAMLQASQRSTGIPLAKDQIGAASYPAIPLRDVVPFPTATHTIFVGREKTIQALNHAFESQREVVLAIQKEAGVDEPGFEDIYEIGVLAQLIEIERLGDGRLKVLIQARRRVAIRRFVGESGSYQADVVDVSEGPIVDAPELIQKTVKRFESYAAVHEIHVPRVWPPLDQARDPGRVADIVCAHVVLPVSDKQSLLATLDPVMRLRRVDALLDSSALPFSPTFEMTRRRAIHCATLRYHRHATLEHLLLALIDDADASAVMLAANADRGALKADVLSFLGDEREGIVVERIGEANPTPAFRRVAQRAQLHARELDGVVVTGAHALLGLFAETRSPAARLLDKHGVSRAHAADIVANRIDKGVRGTTRGDTARG